MLASENAPTDLWIYVGVSFGAPTLKIMTFWDLHWGPLCVETTTDMIDPILPTWAARQFRLLCRRCRGKALYELPNHLKNRVGGVR